MIARTGLIERGLITAHHRLRHILASVAELNQFLPEGGL
jgi:hypothetical protein